MKVIQVPCSECGKLITINEEDKKPKNYCDKFCQNTNQVKEKRANVKLTLKNKNGKVAGCKSCGVKKFDQAK